MLDERDKYVIFMISTEGFKKQTGLIKNNVMVLLQTSFGVKNRAIDGDGCNFSFFVHRNKLSLMVDSK